MLVLPGRASYQALVLPRGSRMTPELAERLADFMERGLLVIGTPPTASPGAEMMAAFDRRVKAASARMRLVGYHAAAALGVLLADRGLAADVVMAPEDISVEWAHPSGRSWDVYFFSNQSDVARRPTDPVVAIEGDAAAIRLGPVNALASLLVSRRGQWSIRRASGAGQVIRVPALPDRVTIDGPWTIAFGNGPMRPWPALGSWSDNPDALIRFFSGTARYVARFDVPSGIDSGRLGRMLDL